MDVDVYVGAEYVIANALIALDREGTDHISVGEVRDVGRALQEYCNSRGIGAVIRTQGTGIEDALVRYPEHFESMRADGGPVIRVREGVSLSRLKQRFMGYLPLDIIRILTEELPRHLAALRRPCR